MKIYLLSVNETSVVSDVISMLSERNAEKYIIGNTNPERDDIVICFVDKKANSMTNFIAEAYALFCKRVRMIPIVSDGISYLRGSETQFNSKLGFMWCRENFFTEDRVEKLCNAGDKEAFYNSLIGDKPVIHENSHISKIPRSKYPVSTKPNKEIFRCLIFVIIANAYGLIGSIDYIIYMMEQMRMRELLGSSYPIYIQEPVGTEFFMVITPFILIAAAVTHRKQKKYKGNNVHLTLLNILRWLLLIVYVGFVCLMG